MSVTELAQVFHVPAILAFTGALVAQHDSALLFFVGCVVQAAGMIGNVRGLNPVQGRVVAAIGMPSGQMQADLLPLGQAQSRAQLLFH
jgi:hypothetical protein